MTGVPCPICGTEFENENGVCGHVAGKTDDDHEGLGYQEAREMLDDDGSSGSTGEGSPGSDGGLKFPENPDADEPDDDGCPDCGDDDYFDADDLLDAQSFDEDTEQALREHSRVCASCGEVYA